MSTLTTVTTRAAVKRHYLHPFLGGSMCRQVDRYQAVNQAEYDEFAARHHARREVIADLPLCLACGKKAESLMESGPGAVTA